MTTKPKIFTAWHFTESLLTPVMTLKKYVFHLSWLSGEHQSLVMPGVSHLPVHAIIIYSCKNIYLKYLLVLPWLTKISAEYPCVMLNLYRKYSLLGNSLLLLLGLGLYNTQKLLECQELYHLPIFRGFTGLFQKGWTDNMVVWIFVPFLTFVDHGPPRAISCARLIWNSWAQAVLLPPE